ncbi:MAG: hypothetical protein GY838_14220 [bacterium]|nr:hypothetical protein [bacterium]
MTRILHFPWYIVLLAAYPVVRFFEDGFEHIPPSDGVRIFLVHLVLSLMAVRLAGWFLGGLRRGALAVLPLLVVGYFGRLMGWPASLALVVVAMALGFVLRRWHGRVPAVTNILGVMALTLVAVSFVTTLQKASRTNPPTPTALCETPLMPSRTSAETPPDIYYIMVDGMGQPDYLETGYGLPRQDIAGPFERLGFRFVDRARANYNQTALSQAATLNAAPVQNLLSIPDPHAGDRNVLGDLIGDSRVRRALEARGYRTVDFPSGYAVTRQDQGADHREPFFGPNMLEYYLLRDGALPLIERLLGRGPADLPYALRRGRIQYTLDHLPDARRGVPDDRPVFVYAHLMAPHPPFVFDAEGGALPSHRIYSYRDGSHWYKWHEGEDYPELYRGQIRYIARELARSVEEIMANSPRPPVIIIQGDHGPGAQTAWESARRTNHTERMSIFNAWYVLGAPDGVPRADLSAVNTFPVLFNLLFDADLSEWPDRFWFARNSIPLTFQEIGE